MFDLLRALQWGLLALVLLAVGPEALDRFTARPTSCEVLEASSRTVALLFDRDTVRVRLPDGAELTSDVSNADQPIPAGTVACHVSWWRGSAHVRFSAPVAWPALLALLPIVLLALTALARRILARAMSLDAPAHAVRQADRLASAGSRSESDLLAGPLLIATGLTVVLCLLAIDGIDSRGSDPIPWLVSLPLLVALGFVGRAGLRAARGVVATGELRVYAPEPGRIGKPMELTVTTVRPIPPSALSLAATCVRTSQTGVRRLLPSRGTFPLAPLADGTPTTLHRFEFVVPEHPAGEGAWTMGLDLEVAYAPAGKPLVTRRFALPVDRSPA